MRLIIAIVQDPDAGVLMDVLAENGYTATKLSSTGGFLRQGNTTILIGVEDTETAPVMALIKATCHSRKQMKVIPSAIGYPMNGHIQTMPVEVTVGGATIFVMDIVEFIK